MRKVYAILFAFMVMTVLQAQASLPKFITNTDKNKDGKVTKEEFLAFRKAIFEKQGKEFNEEKEAKNFKRFDKDGDGVITINTSNE